VGGGLLASGRCGDDHDPVERVEDLGGRGRAAFGTVASWARRRPGHRRGRAAALGARATSCRQNLLILNSGDGNRPRLVSLAVLMRSWTRASARCRASRNPSCPAAVFGGEGLVAPTVSFLQQRQLGAGVRPFPADDDPHHGRPPVDSRLSRSGEAQTPTTLQISANAEKCRKGTAKLTAVNVDCQFRDAIHDFACIEGFPWSHGCLDGGVDGSTGYRGHGDPQPQITLPQISANAEKPPRIQEIGDCCRR
jgi:hypothetical protein